MTLPWAKTILILCEESGVFANLYRDAGFRVIVYDLKLDPENGDIRTIPYISGGVHGILAFPPCTDLAGSGARWWKSKGAERLNSALALADACLRAVALYSPVFWVLENPVGRLSKFYGPPAQTFNPNEYGGYLDPPGDAYTKRTCLWGKFAMPPKIEVPATEGSKMHLMPPGPDRQALRSKTPEGFARAFFQYNQ